VAEYRSILKNNRVKRIFVLKRDLCSAISFKRSRRELFIDVAEHRSTLKNYISTHYPRFSFMPTGIASIKWEFVLTGSK